MSRSRECGTFVTLLKEGLSYAFAAVLCLSVCLSLLPQLSSDASAQMQYPQIFLAQMDDPMADGTELTVSGTDEYVNLEADIEIDIKNDWAGVNNPENAKYYGYAIRSGHSFHASVSFTFHGAGDYSVEAKEVYGPADDTESGAVSAPSS